MSPRLLVLGGTAFLGRALCRAGLEAGYEVTALARGQSGEVVDGVLLVRADRDHDDALTEVAGESWDGVVDLARQPGHVRRAVRDLSAAAGHYAFVSSISAYADNASGGRDEADTPVLPALTAQEMRGPQDYGPAKVAAEQLVDDGCGADRALLVRAGLIGGPEDTSGRSGYWPWRFAHPGTDDGSVLVPEDDDQPVQLIDVRDLADWIVRAVAQGCSGRVDAVGTPVTLGEVLATSRDVAGHDGPVRSVSSGWLRSQGVAPWAGPRSLPLWLGGDRAAYPVMRRSGERARAAGLRTRPLSQTLADELATLTGPPQGAGLSAEEQTGLLAALDRA